MSLVIAVRNKDRIILGSDKQVSTGNSKAHTATKIWDLLDLPGAVMGSVGSLRATQVIQYSKLVDLNEVSENPIDTAFVINSLVPAIVMRLKENGVSVTTKADGSGSDEGMTDIMIPNSFLFAFKDRCWMIWHDLSVSEMEDYIVVGSGADVAQGALYATKDKNPFDRIVTSIDAAAETTLFVDRGVDLLATKYYSSDDKQIRKALGITDTDLAAMHEGNKNGKNKEERGLTEDLTGTISDIEVDSEMD